MDFLKELLYNLCVPAQERVVYPEELVKAIGERLAASVDGSAQYMPLPRAVLDDFDLILVASGKNWGGTADNLWEKEIFPLHSLAILAGNPETLESLLREIPESDPPPDGLDPAFSFLTCFYLAYLESTGCGPRELEQVREILYQTQRSPSEGQLKIMDPAEKADASYVGSPVKK